MAIKPPNNKTDAKSTIDVVQSRRRMRFLTISMNEIENISSLNAHVTAFFSAMSFFFSTALSILLGVSTGIEKLEPMTKLFFYWGTTLTLIAALVCLGMGIFNMRKKNKIMAIIEKESTEP